MPKTGTLERLMLDTMLQKKIGVTFMDFIGTEINEYNIEQVASNLRSGMYESEDDKQMRMDS